AERDATIRLRDVATGAPNGVILPTVDPRRRRPTISGMPQLGTFGLGSPVTGSLDVSRGLARGRQGGRPQPGCGRVRTCVLERRLPHSPTDTIIVTVREGDPSSPRVLDAPEQSVCLRCPRSYLAGLWEGRGDALGIHGRERKDQPGRYPPHPGNAGKSWAGRDPRGSRGWGAAGQAGRGHQPAGGVRGG